MLRMVGILVVNMAVTGLLYLGTGTGFMAACSAKLIPFTYCEGLGELYLAVHIAAAVAALYVIISLAILINLSVDIKRKGGDDRDV